MNVFGKVFLGIYPGHKASHMEVLDWKTSKNVKWAYENLWSCVDKDGDDPHDTYINRITKEVLKANERNTNNCLFIIAIVDLMFDQNIQTTVLSGELIIKRMEDKMNKQQEIEETDESHDDENANDD